MVQGTLLWVDDEIELAKMTAEYFRMFEVSTYYVDSSASCFAFFEEGNSATKLFKKERR